MSKKLWYGVAVVAFVLLIAGASVLYNSLSASYEPEIPAPDTESTKAEIALTTRDFTVTDAAGNDVKLSDMVGKPVVVNFWATWCGYCIEELPAFEELSQRYGDRVQFMMINCTDGARETVDKAKAYLENGGYTFPDYYDTTYDAARTYSVYSIPRTLFIDADGQLAYDRPGAMSASQLELYIQSYLGVT